MWEFEIVNKNTDETKIIFGYTLSDAYRRYKLNPEEWILVLRTYVD